MGDIFFETFLYTADMLCIPHSTVELIYYFIYSHLVTL